MILGINTASSTTELALIDNNNPTSELLLYKSWKSDNNEATILLPQLHEMLKTLNKSFQDITELILITGPGSFTGLRIGITVANTIAYLLKIPVKPLNTFQYWWLLSKNQETTLDNKALLIFAGKQGVYISPTAEEIGKLYSLEQADIYLNENNINHIFGDLTNEQIAFFQSRKFHDIKPSLGDTIISNHTLLNDIKPHKRPIAPLYIKDPGITTPKP